MSPKGDRTAALTFIPSEVGWHEVLAETDADQFPTSVYATEEHFVVLAQLGRACSWVERFADGAFLCDGVFLRPGETEQPLDAQLSALGGDAVWTFKDGQLARLLEPRSGTLFTRPQQSLDLGQLEARRLIGTPTDVLVIHGGGVLRVELDSHGTLSLTGQWARAITSEMSLRRTGDSLLIGEPLVPWVIGTEPSAASSPGARLEICAYALSSPEIGQTGCRVYEGELLGESDEGLLMRDKFVLRAVRASLDDGFELEIPRLALPGVSRTSTGIAQLPWDLVPRHEGAALSLIAYRGVTGASDQLVWSARPNGITIVMRR